MSRPDTNHLSKIYQNLGLEWVLLHHLLPRGSLRADDTAGYRSYDERVLPSIGNEVLKATVAQFDAAELITQREVVSARIRQDLLNRAKEFNILLEDVSIVGGFVCFPLAWRYLGRRWRRRVG